MSNEKTVEVGFSSIVEEPSEEEIQEELRSLAKMNIRRDKVRRLLLEVQKQNILANKHTRGSNEMTLKSLHLSSDLLMVHDLGFLFLNATQLVGLDLVFFSPLASGYTAVASEGVSDGRGQEAAPCHADEVQA